MRIVILDLALIFIPASATVNQLDVKVDIISTLTFAFVLKNPSSHAQSGVLLATFLMKNLVLASNLMSVSLNASLGNG